MSDLYHALQLTLAVVGITGIVVTAAFGALVGLGLYAFTQLVAAMLGQGRHGR